MAEPQRPNPAMQAIRPGRRGPVVEVEKPKNMKGTLRRLVGYIGRNRRSFFVLLAVTLMITGTNLLAPSLQQRAIDSIEGNLPAQLGLMLIFMVFTYLLNAALTYLQGIFSAKLAQGTVRTMRKDLFARLVRLPIRYTDTHNHGDIMSRMTNDVENISNSISSSIASLCSSVLMVVGCFIIMICYSPLLALVSTATIFLTLLASTFITKFMRKFFVRQQRILGDVNGQVEEMVSGYRTVVAYNRQERAIRDFNATSDHLKKTAIYANIFGGCMGPVMNFITNVGFLLIAIVGGYLASLSPEHILHISVGTIQAFILYSKQFSRPINEIANQYATIQTAIAGAERIFDVMDSETEDAGGNAPYDPKTVKGALSFRDVHFSYVPEKPVLQGFNLEVKAGQKIAIVGATGSGKTTVVNLLTRFYDIDSGTITVDGTPLNEIPRSELRKSLAIVLQDTVLFSDTIARNIAYSRPDATREEIIAAAESAGADRFIRRLEQGYDTLLTEGGGNLSQGQRQLLNIARAVLADPSILILDEATSSVDTRTEMHIQSAMVALMKNRTSLIIAHRLSTIRDADKIIVIDHGKVVEEGNHDTLLAQKGTYYNLYQSQFSGIAT
ncbi:MAG: ABC transporter ATP-binding protein [Clostridia bacterium]|nr:ABC transporter ATP-binding protein [Clostridia bacterium]